MIIKGILLGLSRTKSEINSSCQSHSNPHLHTFTHKHTDTQTHTRTHTKHTHTNNRQNTVNTQDTYIKHFTDNIQGAVNNRK